MAITARFKEYLVIYINILPIIFAAVRTDLSQSSFFEIRENYAVLGHVIKVQSSLDIMSCAQMCLLDPKCLSANFDDRDAHDKFCELNDVSVSPQTEASKLTRRKGFTYTALLDMKLQTYVFTSLGAEGSEGPISVDGYKGTPLEGKVQVQKGIQLWDVPSTGSYSIEAFGASGGNGTCEMCTGWKLGGMGARIKGIFKLNSGTRLNILVGQKGVYGTKFFDKPGGGGGGTFVLLATGLKPLVIAGGGGGGGMARDGYSDGDHGQASQQGSHKGGSNGQGGQVESPVQVQLLAGSGAGFLGNGSIAMSREPATAFIYGGNGGLDNGGFGGGGWGLAFPGGGGGYSGGGLIGNATTGSAGGGGSYNAGSGQENEAGVNKGNGRVVITLIN